LQNPQPLIWYNFLGGLCWAIGVSALGSWLGNTIADIDHYLLPLLGVIGLLALSPTLVHLLKHAVKQRARRKLREILSLESLDLKSIMTRL